MKWSEPQQNDERIIIRFLILPLTIDYETRWLEFVKIKQRYDEYRYKWINSRWVD